MKLEMVIARDTKNVRKNNDTINNNKTIRQQQYINVKSLYLFSLIWMVRGQYQEKDPKVINMSYWQWRTIFTDFDSNGAVRNRKTIYFLYIYSCSSDDMPQSGQHQFYNLVYQIFQ